MMKFCWGLLVALTWTVGCDGALTEYWTADKPDMNLYMDPFAPFFHGVTSGDPLPDSVILWTRATPRTDEQVRDGLQVSWRLWELATGNFSEAEPILEGFAFADPERDYTVKVDANPLPFTNHTYFYRFYFGDEPSRLGRTRSAPGPDEMGILTFGVTSCSQHQLYQNTFAHLAYNMTLGGLVEEQYRGWSDEYLEMSESISAMLDLGDWIYDTNEKTTWQRTPTETCEEAKPELAREIPNRASLIDPAFAPLPLRSKMNCTWQTGGDEEQIEPETFWRWRHSNDHMDPDVRAARAAHPWIHLVDSHDVGNNSTLNVNDPGLKVFEYWTPVRWEENDFKFRLFRKFRFGAIADVAVMDTRNVGLENETYIDADGESDIERNAQGRGIYLGTEQREWFRTQVIAANTTTEGWRLLLTGKAFTAWHFDNFIWFSTKIAFLLWFLAFLPVLCCFQARRIKRRYPNERTSLSLSSITEDEDDPDQMAITDFEKVIDAKAKDLDTPFSLKQRSLNVCASRCCCRAGAALAVFLVILWAVVLIVGTILLPIEPDTGVLNPFAKVKTWDGNAIDRMEMMKDLADADSVMPAKGNIFLSGDMHMLAASDVLQSTRGHRLVVPKEDPRLVGRNLPSDAEIEASESVGVEWLPSSTSSRGIDDFFYATIPFQGVINFIANLVQDLIFSSTDHMRSFDTIQHGIGYVHLGENEARMDFYRNDVFFPFRKAPLTWQGNVKPYQYRWDTADFLP